MHTFAVIMSNQMHHFDCLSLMTELKHVPFWRKFHFNITSLAGVRPSLLQCAVKYWSCLKQSPKLFHILSHSNYCFSLHRSQLLSSAPPLPPSCFFFQCSFHSGLQLFQCFSSPSAPTLLIHKIMMKSSHV